MFKDYEKYLSKSLEMYLFVLVIIFILKIVGLDYFGIDINNPIMIKINTFCLENHIDIIWYFVNLYFQLYFYLCLVCNKQKLFLSTFIGTILNIILQFFITKFFTAAWIYPITSTILLFVLPMFINKKFFIKRQIIGLLFVYLYQLISLFVRSVGVNTNFGDFITDSILNLDQLMLYAITYKIYFMKGDLKCLQEVGFSSLKKINLKKSLQNLQRNFQNSKESFKKKSKEEKLSIIIFIILSSIWNLLTLVIVLLIAKLNDTLVECIFILSSFWLSKRAFGKAFHFDSMILCFIVSNLTYYTLNRITTPLGISIFIPILLGVGLSYVTSKFVKKKYKPLYRGMSKDLFEETILQVVEKDSDKYKICYEFYIDKKSDLSLSYKYNYSVSGIRKIKDRINSKIKRL